MDDWFIVEAGGATVLKVVCHGCRASPLFLVGVRSLALGSTSVCFLVLNAQ